MSLGNCECEEHLGGVPVDTGFHDLGAGYDSGSDESAPGVTKYVAP